MTDLKKVKLIEGILVPVLVVCYAIRQLFDAAREFDVMLADARQRYIIPARVIRADLASYSHEMNVMFPIIAGAVLLIAGWMVFHFVAFPNLQKGVIHQNFIASFVISTLFVVASLFIFSYFRHYVRYAMRPLPFPDGFLVYSQFRKRTLLADVVGVFIAFGAYEWMAQFYYYLFRRFRRENDDYPVSGIHLNILNFLLPVPIIALMLFLAFSANLPQTIWSGSTGDVLFLCGCGLLVTIVQSMLYSDILLVKFRLDDPELAVKIVTLLTVWAGGIFVLTYVYTRFQYFNQWLFVVSAPIILLLGVTAAFVRKSFSTETIGLRTSVSAKSAQLASLRSQINPHFLFNALNSLYTAALKEGGERTADGIQKLGDMMRFMLQENNHDRIPLHKEIEYLDNYIHIQRIRIDESQGIDIRVRIQQPPREIYIAPMMLLPFVENAFKHGISHVHPSWIFITLSFDESSLYFKVHNSLHPRHENDPEETHSGIGLENVKKRLELIYANRFQLEIQPSGQDYFVGLKLMYW